MLTHSSLVPRILWREYSSGGSGSFTSNICHDSSLPTPKILTPKILFVNKSLQRMHTCLRYCAFKLLKLDVVNKLMHTEDRNVLTFVPKQTLVQITFSCYLSKSMLGFCLALSISNMRKIDNFVSKTYIGLFH